MRGGVIRLVHLIVVKLVWVVLLYSKVYEINESYINNLVIKR